ncbi:MAG: addiction module toxin RelE [Alphaproteobacteria bacterium RIFCSPHIGHO2_12_FULL_45_9]|nr:MAG: addiction module toxin RelE [Alphaproteobacteria bacterium RIFCSPHIGHO2_12_FULL_45_9]
MQVVQTTKFRKSYKRLHENQRQELNKVLEAIISDPTLGEQKKGDLSWLRVHKCKIVNSLTLVGYHIDDGQLILTFVAVGSHENFYRDLKA